MFFPVCFQSKECSLMLEMNAWLEYIGSNGLYNKAYNKKAGNSYFWFIYGDKRAYKPTTQRMNAMVHAILQALMYWNS